MATSAQYTDRLATGSSPYRQSLTGIQEEEKTQRGMRSFLTWSFFLAQIAIADEALGTSSGRPTPDAPSPMGRGAASEAATMASAPLDAPVPAQTDTMPQLQPERLADGGRLSSMDDRADGGAPATPLIGEPDENAPRMTAVSGGGSGGADASDGGVSAVEGDWIPGIDLNIPGLLGDVIDIADGTLSALTDSLPGELVGDVLDTAGRIVSILDDGIDAGLDGGLFVQTDIASSHIMLAANLTGDAATGPYPDALLALTATSSEEAPAAMPTPSFLHSLPLIGDVLSQPEDRAADDQTPPYQADITADITHLLDHAGAKSIGDLWS